MGFDPRQLQLGGLYSRPELARMWGYVGYQAIAKGVVTPRGGRHIILFVTREKQQALTQYRDFINGDHLHWEGEARHGNDDRIARAHTRGEEVYLFYRDIHHTPFRYHGPLELLQFEQQDAEPSRFVFRLVHDLSANDDIAVHSRELEVLSETERERIVRARLGQGKFREDLLTYWKACAITGIASPELLKASHIKPWRWSDNIERLSPFNGLLLLPQYDHLFDRGYITFDDKGKMEPSPAIVALPPALLGIEMNARLRDIAEEHLPFLDFHRRKMFISKLEKD